jgi:anti-sigma factor RsiW
VTCREFADFMLDYASGELPAAIRDTFEQHVSRCANCRAYLELYRRTVEIGRRVAAANLEAATSCGVPEDLVAAILAARAAPTPDAR